ncbi:hypothetical protein [Bartonella bacilliformis]|uniref:Uncharacterized protein n=1 Tax=Bartonella bacilliformis Ver097 TaxID=1293911 RepID=A0A072R6P1_BARBA|nr:hypothetical protein [Bartonella bacilliformis]KEG21331.1 hypothetical protein H710_00280 [Bartonella bacilliformis Ver097]
MMVFMQLLIDCVVERFWGMQAAAFLKTSLLVGDLSYAGVSYTVRVKDVFTWHLYNHWPKAVT